MNQNFVTITWNQQNWYQIISILLNLRDLYWQYKNQMGKLIWKFLACNGIHLAWQGNYWMGMEPRGRRSMVLMFMPPIFMPLLSSGACRWSLAYVEMCSRWLYLDVFKYLSNGHILMGYLATFDILVCAFYPLEAYLFAYETFSLMGSEWYVICIVEEYTMLTSIAGCTITYVMISVDRFVVL